MIDFLMKLTAKYLGWWLMKKWPNDPVKRNLEGYNQFKAEMSKYIKKNYK